jgi:hypothetical protein
LLTARAWKRRVLQTTAIFAESLDMLAPKLRDYWNSMPAITSWGIT